MKKWISVSLAAGLLALSPAALLAQNSTAASANSGPSTTQSAAAKKKGAERREVMAILGIKGKDSKGLSPADRRAKIKEAADKMIADLEQKKAAGSLTDKEQSNLALLKNFERHGRGKAKSGS